MTKVVLQPCGEGSAAKHYLDTVEHPVSLDRIAPLVPAVDASNLRKLFINGEAATWGVIPGKLSGGAKKWNRMEIGDLALFCGNGKLFSAGVVVYKTHNRELAHALWANDEAGNTWEYIYFLKELRTLDIPYSEFNKAAGYAENNIVRGFTVLTDEKSEAVLALIDFKSAANTIEEELEEIRRAPEEIEEFNAASETEGRQKTLTSICRRQGQPEFRRKLIAAYGGRCAITGCDAVQTLEAAHIIPYDGPKTNHPANGILLRSDLHILFDLGHLSINPATYEVCLSKALMKTSYADFHGKKLYTPTEPKHCPNTDALTAHAKACIL